MNYLGQYFDRKIYWIDYQSMHIDNLPTSDWVMLAISNHEVDIDKFTNFAIASIDRGLLEFKGAGCQGETLHQIFDTIMVNLEIEQKRPFIDIGTTGSSDETLNYTFWQCFFATTLPDKTNFDDLKIVCLDLDSIDRRDELLRYIKNFESGWSPGNQKNNN